MLKLSPIFNISKTRIVDREEEILSLCKNKKVLHVGCADTPYTLQREDDLLHRRISKITDQLWGIDLSIEGCSLLRKMGFDHIITGDINELAHELKKEAFDIIIAGETIEHTYNAGAFLDGIVKTMENHTELLLTTVNTPSTKQIIFAVMRKEKVHPDHNYYFSYHTLKHFFEKCGLSPTEIYYYNVNINMIDKILSIFKYISPVLSDGIIVRARLKSYV